MWAVLQHADQWLNGDVDKQWRKWVALSKSAGLREACSNVTIDIEVDVGRAEQVHDGVDQSHW